MSEPFDGDLDAFAAARERKPACWACGIPEADEINAGRRKGRHVTLIHDYLLSKGHPPELATMSRLKRHFQEGHHERG